MEFKIEEHSLPKPWSFNFEELKAELTSKTEFYAHLAYTDDQVAQAKADRASLNKLKTAINAERVKREKEYMEPFNTFKAQVREIIAIIDQPIAAIDNQLRAFEEQRVEEKRQQIREIWDGIFKPEWLQLDRIYNPKWENATASRKSITDEMKEAVAGIFNDIDTIVALDEFADEAISEYKKTLSLNMTLGMVSNMKRMKRAVEEAEARKAEEERLKREAEEAAKNAQAETVAPAADRTEPSEEEPAREWVSFSAYISRDDAIALKEFFCARGIVFKRV